MRHILPKAMLMAVAGLTWTVPASALTITPEYNSTITSDPNFSQIDAAIQSVISNYQTAFSGTNLTLEVNVLEDSTIGGANNSPNTVTEGYAATIDAMQSHATTLDNVAVMSKVSPLGLNPLTGTASGFQMSVANAAALGLSGGHDQCARIDRFLQWCDQCDRVDHDRRHPTRPHFGRATVTTSYLNNLANRCSPTSWTRSLRPFPGCNGAGRRSPST